MTDLREVFAKSLDSQNLHSENESLKTQIYDLTEQCQKLEKRAKEFERLITEQSSLLKALNVGTNFYFLFATCLLSGVLLVYAHFP